MNDPARNKEMSQRFKNGETIASLARAYRISSTRVREILRQERAKEPWCYEKLPTVVRNALANFLFHETGQDIWTLPEVEAAKIVAKYSEAELDRQPNIGAVAIMRIQDWLESNGLRLRQDNVTS
jgi:hypothetical protein